MPGCLKEGTWRRQNTNFENDRDNWGCYCPQCQIEEDEYWKERWLEYYHSVL